MYLFEHVCVCRGSEGGPVCASLNEVLPEMLPPCRHGVVRDYCDNAMCMKVRLRMRDQAESEGLG